MSDVEEPPLIRCSEYAFYLDLDGTLAPIVDHPDDVVIEPKMLDLLNWLKTASNGAVAILSGRSLAEIDGIIAPVVLHAAGEHGAETRGAGGMRQAVKLPAEAYTEISSFAQSHDLLVERKAGGAALHYRTSPGHAEASKDFMQMLAARHEGFRVLHGKMVSEIASVVCSKETALRDFAMVAPFQDRLPVMIGDDVTDEDGFRAARSLGGFGIKVGEGDTVASYRLASISNLYNWLSSLLK